MPSGWGPAVPTEILHSQLGSGSAHGALRSRYRSSGLAFPMAPAVKARQCQLTCGARGWGPAVPTEICRSRLRSGSAHWHVELAVEVRQCPLRSGACSWGLEGPIEIQNSQLRSKAAGGEEGEGSNSDKLQRPSPDFMWHNSILTCIKWHLYWHLTRSGEVHRSCSWFRNLNACSAGQFSRLSKFFFSWQLWPMNWMMTWVTWDHKSQPPSPALPCQESERPDPTPGSRTSASDPFWHPWMASMARLWPGRLQLPKGDSDIYWPNAVGWGTRRLSVLHVIINDDTWHGLYNMMVDLNSFICKWPFFAHKKYFRKSFANPAFIFPGGLMLKSFAKYVAQEKILRGGAHVGTLAAFVMDDLYMDHFIDNYT